MSIQPNNLSIDTPHLNQMFIDTINIMNNLIEQTATNKSQAFLNHVLTKTESAIEGISKMKMNDHQRLLLSTIDWKFTVFKAELYLDYLSFITK